MASIKSAKQKGRIFEVWCRNVLALSLGLPFDAMNSRGAGAPGCDSWPSTAIRELIPYCVESKARTSLTPYQTMKQARGNCYEGLFPLAMAHNRGEHLTFMPTLHFLARLSQGTAYLGLSLVLVFDALLPLARVRVPRIAREVGGITLAGLHLRREGARPRRADGGQAADTERGRRVAQHAQG